MERKISFTISVINDGDHIKDVSFGFDSETKEDAIKLFIASFATTFEYAIKNGEDRTKLGTLAAMMLGDLVREQGELSVKEEVKLKGEMRNGKIANNLN